MGNTISVAEKKLKIEKYIISYIKKNLDKNITYEDIKKILLNKTKEYNLDDEILIKNYMESCNIIKKNRIMYKKENKYLDEKKLVDDYFQIENNITSLDLETINNTVKFQNNMFKFLNYLKKNKIKEKLHKYLLDYHYVEKKNLDILYVENKIINYLDIIIKKKTENLKIRKAKNLKLKKENLQKQK